MLLKLIWYSFVSFFSIYGIVQLVFYICDFCYDFKTLKSKIIYTMVAVKNEEKEVEGIAKALLWKSLRNDSGMADNRVVIIDMGSTDKTKEIVKKMEEDNKGIILLNKDDLIEDLEKSI